MTAPDADARKAEAAHVQRRAADPAASVWVTASAGTGKTKVLTDRVLSLMLAGTPPAKVLCLTFTKAAAAEMAQRLARELAGWVAMSDKELSGRLSELTGRAPRPEDLPRARALFARVLDAPGGMKIQTIHAFCQAVLARFPLEAGIAPHFQVLDETSTDEMLRDAREAVLARAGGGDDPALAEALDIVTAQVNEDDFDKLMAKLIAERGRLTRLLREAGGAGALGDKAAAALGVDPAETPERLRRAACDDAAFEGLALRVALDAIRTRGTAKEQEKAAVLEHWLSADVDGRVAAFDSYAKVFLKQDGEPRKNPLTKAAAEVPGALDAMQAETERLLVLKDRESAATVARATSALLRLGAAILDAYGERKARRALLDYDDLILKTRDLLRRPGLAPWVLFKLDGGLDHILIDEAQDTNPDQWEVVEALSAEFFAGEGAAAARGAEPRTVFAVGDAKQSIYSFQRADPSAFARMRAHFAERVRAARQGWTPVELHHSFRSTAAVLGAVDAVFARPEAQDGVLFDESALRHEPVRAGQPGRVELWPLAEHAAAEDDTPWAPPTEPQEAAHPRERLARLIARRIRRWTRDGDGEGFLPARDRQMRPGDVLVLVRRRNEFVDELVRALKQQDVPVAGVDRMVLTEQLAVQDLVALGRFLLLPSDDLTLACVLKGPLIDLPEARLFDLAYDRPGRLWDALRTRAGEAADFEEAYARLSDLLALADYKRPYELYADLLGREGGRAALLARLGSEAGEPIEEFLSLALAYERREVASLEGFLHWLEAGGQEIKRESEQGRDAVRVMTVHGAKGLQAPVVLLPDSVQLPGARNDAGDKLFFDTGRGRLLWAPRKAVETAPVQRLRAAAEQARAQEYRRLLYVAMTRAEDRLYVCGWAPKKGEPPADGWYRLVRHGLTEVADEIAFDSTGEIADGWQGTALRYAGPPIAAPVAKPDTPPLDRDGATAQPLPDWAMQPPASEPAPPRPLAPSQAGEDEPPVRSPLAGDGAGFQRGRLIHRMLQSLPDVPADRRRPAGQRFLANAAPELDATERDALLEETLAVIEGPDFAHLFGPDSRAEVPVVGLLDGAAGPQALSGQIDRLVVTEDAVVVVDFKTNRPPARTPDEVPALYRRQLAAYRDLLERVYPGRRVETWLLWTDGPRLMQVEAG